MSEGLKLIASILENGSTSTLRALDPAVLVDNEEHQAEQYVRRHFLRYGRLPDISTVEDDLDIEFPDTPEDVDFYLQNVHNRHVYNGARESFPELRNAIKEANIDNIRDAAADIYALCVPYSSDNKEMLTLHEAGEGVVEAYLSTRNIGGLYGLTTGFPYLDTQTDGYQNSDLIIWVARPGVGKTWMLIHQAVSAWLAGKSILFVSMEMGLHQIAKRIACYIAGIDPRLYNTRKLSMFAVQRLQRAMDTLNRANNFHLFAGNFNKTTASVDMMVRELAPDGIYIDGMYLMTPEKSRNNMGRYEAVAYVLDELKRMALMRDRPVIATTQFNREAGSKGKKGSLENIGYSDAIATHASVIMSAQTGRGVEKPIITLENDELRNMGHYMTYPYRVVEVMKGREGESGEFGLHYGFAPTNFAEAPLAIAKQPEEGEPDPHITEHME